MSLELKVTFNQAAEQYHRSRPGYPVELFDKLVADTQLTKNAKLLEIGPGTGQATRSLAERGYDITAVELGNELADKAREVLAEFKNVQIITGAFEDVELSAKTYDLVYSATAFHWIKPEYKFTKPHRLLKPGGHLAIIHTEHISDNAGDKYFYAGTPLYDTYRGDGKKEDDYTPPTLDEVQPPALDTNLFSLVSFTPFRMVVTYTSQEYIDLLATFSPQLAMPEAKRNEFLGKLKDLMDNEFGGRVEKHYGMTLAIAERI